MSTPRPTLGFGVGLRPKHYGAFLEQSPKCDFIEAISENFMGLGGRPRAVLERARRDRPVLLHGVSLGIASVEPLDERYLREWKSLIDAVEPALVSDHLCWGRAKGRYAHDLLPVPFTQEAVRHVVERVGRVQDLLGRRLVLENVSSYVTYAHSELTEWEFLVEVLERADCQLLLDVNNVYVSSQNHHFDPDTYLAAIPPARVVQYHLAGHERAPKLIIDTHDGPVSREVWALYRQALQRFGNPGTLIEWDAGVPPLERLLEEQELARSIASAVTTTLDPPGRRHLQSWGPLPASLAHTQQLIFEAVCEPVEISPQSQALVSREGLERLEVYAGMYWARMRETMGLTFPTVARLAAERFEPLVADYLRAHPSTHFSLDQLGHAFPEFLLTHGPAWAAVAALEWARAQAFVAADAPTSTFEALTAIDAERWQDCALTLHPSVRVLKVERAALAALRGEASVSSAVGSVVVWRKGFEVFHVEVDPLEGSALELALAEATLDAVLEPFSAEADAAQRAMQALQSWFNEGMVSRIRSRA